jgi:hypothetical protein
MKTFPAADIHGRTTLKEGLALLPAANLKAVKRTRASFRKPKNGYNCQYTYFHVLDALLDVIPGTMVKASDLVESLQDRPIEFDATTVGRVIADIAESIEMVNGKPSIMHARYWDGTRYWTTPDLEARMSLENLLQDLIPLCDSGITLTASPLFSTATTRVFAKTG